MFVYFLPKEETVALKNGEKLFALDEPRKTEGAEHDLFTLLKPGFLPETFCFSAEQNPECVTLYEYNGGYIVDADGLKKPSYDFYYRKSLYPQTFVTVSANFVLVINVAVNGVVLRVTDDFFPTFAEAEIINPFGENLIKLELSDGETTRLFLFGFNGKPYILFKNDVCSYSFENGFTAKTKLGNLKQSELSVTRTMKNGNFVIEGFTRKDENDRVFSDEFVPLLFLEELLYSGDCKKYLSDELAERFEDLKAFTGDFSRILPPPEYEKGVFLLCEKKGDKRFKATPFKFDADKGKITGVKKL